MKFGERDEHLRARRRRANEVRRTGRASDRPLLCKEPTRMKSGERDEPPIVQVFYASRRE
jgi:hypothetical protein